MSQKKKIVNFLIQDTNGQPKVVKVVQNSTKLPSPPSKIKSSPIKVYKLPLIAPNSGYQSVKVTGDVVHYQSVKKVPDCPVIVKTEPTHSIEVEIEPTEESENEDLIPELVPLPVKHTTIYTSPNSSTPVPVSISEVMSHTSRRRHMVEEPNASPEIHAYTTKRRKHADKVGKGLRHFSMKVCEKVRNKGFTSYNEVADELVAEFAAGMHSQTYDQKNIRRRVYDALNVLMAMNIISKEKKEIRWLGLPTNSVQECTTLEVEKRAKIDRIQEKTQHLQELILRHISFKNLIERNKQAEEKGLNPSTASAIHLPFIVVNTDEDAVIQCSISNDKTEYMFNFDKTFHINDDVEILKRMGLHFGLDKGKCPEADIEKAKKMVPKSLEHFVEEMGQGVQLDLSKLLSSEEMTDQLEDEEDEEEEEEVPEDDDDTDQSSDDIDV